jgi:hypothetical protein
LWTEQAIEENSFRSDLEPAETIHPGPSLVEMVSQARLEMSLAKR